VFGSCLCVNHIAGCGARTGIARRSVRADAGHGPRDEISAQALMNLMIGLMPRTGEPSQRFAHEAAQTESGFWFAPASVFAEKSALA